MFSALLASNPGSKLLLWLIIFAIAMSAVSLYYYLRVLKSAFVADSPEGATEVRSTVLMKLVVGLLAAAVIALGCAPDLILSQILKVIQASGL